MIEFLLRDGNFPFTVALGVMAALGLLEIFSALLGFALSSLVDNLIPEIDFDLDADLDGIPDHGGLASVAHWLHFGEAPTLVLFIVFLTSFGLSGWGVQAAAREWLGHSLSVWLAVVPAIVFGFLAMNLCGSFFAKIGLRDETTAVSADSLIGKSGIITLGATRAGQPSQAKVRDNHGLTHYVLVEPLRADAEYASGASVLLVQREGAKYLVIEDSIDALLDLGREDLPTEQRQKA